MIFFKDWIGSGTCRIGVISLTAMSVGMWTDGVDGEADAEKHRPVAFTTALKPIVGGEILEESIRSLAIDRKLVPVVKKELREQGRVVLEDVPLPDGGSINLEMHGQNVFPPGARLVMELGEGQKTSVSHPLALPKDALVLSGHIQGDEGSFAVLAHWDGGTMGLFKGAHGTSVISSGKFGDPQAALIYDPQYARDGAFAASTWECHTDEIATEIEQTHLKNARGRSTEGGLAGGEYDGCELVEVGIEYDFEMYNNVLGSDGQAAIMYTAFLIISLDEIFRREVGVQMQCTFLKVRPDVNDPWFQPPPNGGSRLQQLIDYYADEDNDYDPWNPDWRPDIYTLLSGRGGGGKGQTSTCANPAHVFLASMEGAFPYPLERVSAENYDLFGTAHEFGHVLGGKHTWRYCPPLDTCRNATNVNCSGPYTQNCMSGTLMSYCHLCSGGVSNIRLEFHETVKADIRDHLDEIDCLGLELNGVRAVDDAAQTSRGTAVTIDVLLNDQAECAAPLIRAHNVLTEQGGFVNRLVGEGPFGRDLLRYIPPAGFPDSVLGVDSFAYLSEGAFGIQEWATVTIKVWGRTLDYLVVDSGRKSVERFDAATNQYIDPLIESINSLLVDPSAACATKDGKLLIADVGIDKILGFDMETGAFLDTFHSSQYIEHPIDLISTETHVYVGSRDKQSVVVLTHDGELETVLQSGGPVQDLLIDEQSEQLVVLRGSGNFDGAYEVWDLATEQMLMMQPVTELESVSSIALHPDGDFLVADRVSGNIARYNTQNQGFVGWFLHWEVARFFGIGELIRIEVGIDDHIYIASSTGVHRLTLEGWYVDKALLADNESFEWPSAFLFLDAALLPGDLDGNGTVDGMDLGLLLGNWNGSGVGDIDGNGIVDGADLALLLGSWSSN